MHNFRSTIGYSLKSNKLSKTPRSYSKKRLGNNEQERFSFLYSDRKNSKAERGKKTYIDHQTVENYLKNIFKYLTSSNFPQKIKKNSLKLPSYNLFVKIFYFLAEKIDPSIQEYDFSQEELIVILKNFGCSPSLNEVTFQSIGVPSNWNLLLGVLNQLCEIVKEIDQLENMILEDNQEDYFQHTNPIHKNVFFEIMEIHQIETEEQISEQFDKQIVQYNKKDKLKQMSKENLKMKIENQKQIQQPIESLQQESIDKGVKIENLQLLLEKRKAEFENQQENLNKININIQENDLIQKNLESQIQKLQAIIDNQGISKEESDLIEKENESLKVKLDTILKNIENLINQHSNNFNQFNAIQINFLENLQKIKSQFDFNNFKIEDFQINFTKNFTNISNQLDQYQLLLQNQSSQLQLDLQENQKENSKLIKENLQLIQQLKILEEEIQDINRLLQTQRQQNEEYKNSKNLEDQNIYHSFQQNNLTLKNLKQNIQELKVNEQKQLKEMSQIEKHIQQAEQDNVDIQEALRVQKNKNINFLMNYKIKVGKILQMTIDEYQKNEDFLKNFNQSFFLQKSNINNFKKLNEIFISQFKNKQFFFLHFNLYLKSINFECVYFNENENQ